MSWRIECDTVACSLPGITPNTSQLTVSVTPAASLTAATNAPATLLTPSKPSIKLDQMTATAVLSWKEFAGVQYSQVVGCQVITPAYTVSVYQVSGWEEAQARPEEHGWAAPFTWLNIDLKMTARLDGPVTGILGDTYPKDLPHGKSTPQGAEHSTAQHGAGAGEVLGEPWGGAANLGAAGGADRSLAADASTHPSSPFHQLTASLGMGTMGR